MFGIGTKESQLFWQSDFVNTPSIVGNIYILTFIIQQKFALPDIYEE
jgi:hypothetical protein